MLDKKIKEIRAKELNLVSKDLFYHHSSDSKLKLFRFEKYLDKKSFYLGLEAMVQYLADNEYLTKSELVLKSGPILLKQRPLYLTSFYDDYTNKNLWKKDATLPVKTDQDSLNCCAVIDYQNDMDNNLYMGKVICDKDYWFNYFEEVFQFLDEKTLDYLKSQRSDLVKLGLEEDMAFRTYLLIDEIIKTSPLLAFNAQDSEEYRLVKHLDPSDKNFENILSKDFIEINLSDDSSLSFEKLLCRKPVNKVNKNVGKTNQGDYENAKQQDLFS